MRPEPTCPRCGAVVHAPGLWTSAWTCPVHGDVLPVQPVVQPTAEVLAAAAVDSRVPIWVPWPLPKGWLVTGVACAGDARTGSRATALACSGPNPLGGMGELVLVAEEPGIGFGALFAAMPGPDPGSVPTGEAPHAKVSAAGHPCPLWTVGEAADRATYVGEAGGCWLWAVLWPDSAGVLMLESLVLCDARDLGHEIPLVPMGALSPRLANPAA